MPLWGKAFNLTCHVFLSIHRLLKGPCVKTASATDGVFLFLFVLAAQENNSTEKWHLVHPPMGIKSSFLASLRPRKRRTEDL